MTRRSHCVAMLTASLILAAPVIASAAQKFKIDPVHSAVVFRIGHLNLGQVYGRFNEPAGNIVLDAENPASTSFDVQIQTASIDTNNAKRDEHLRSPDFFNARQFPLITFKSTGVKPLENNSYEVTGELTVHGQTRPITVTVNKIGEGKDPWGNYRAGFASVFTIKRSDFGMSFMPDAVGDEVTLMVAFEGIRE